MPILSARRPPAHVLVVIGAWILFLLGWIKVLRSTAPGTMIVSVVVAAATLVVVVAVTAWWIRHNVGIFRRKGPRQEVRVTRQVVTTDFLGRAIEADWETVRSSPMVLVVTSAGRKDLIALRTGP